MSLVLAFAQNLGVTVDGKGHDMNVALIRKNINSKTHLNETYAL